jgi:hypothetical protein
LRARGYVVLIEDIERRVIRPDVLAYNPKTKRHVWIEVETPRGKQGVLKLSEKFSKVERLMERVGGELVIVRLDEDDLMEMSDERGDVS